MGMNEVNLVQIYRQMRDSFEEFLSTNEGGKLYFAFSGGKDSVVVLHQLIPICKKHNIDLCAFTVDTGFKGTLTWENINRCVQFMNLEHRFEILDVRQRKFSTPEILKQFNNPVTSMEMYAMCFEESILPCGKLCNSMMDTMYREYAASKGVSHILTGGDTPKKDKDGHYTIFWEKIKGITIVRAGAALHVTKHANSQYIQQHNIPWIDPCCGGYDTDCLVPGAVFRSWHEKEGICGKEIAIVQDYFGERTFWDVYTNDEQSQQLDSLDVASDNS